MFRLYGVIGALLIVFVQLNFFLKIQPFASWYFPLIWFGYILVLDAIVYKLRKDSLISNRFSHFLGMIFLSMVIWWIFELLNLSVRNWSYISTVTMSEGARLVMKNLAFATVLPAVMETAELFRALHLFSHAHLQKHYRITKTFVHRLIEIGVAFLVLPFFFPAFAYPLVWLSFFLILDPLNYLHHQPSILGHLKKRTLTVPLTLLVAGLVCGFLWEFWNYWAAIKWVYDIPFVGFFKIFEMPLLGYLGYLPFALELYAMYWFARGLFVQKETLLK